MPMACRSINGERDTCATLQVQARRSRYTVADEKSGSDAPALQFFSLVIAIGAVAAVTSRKFKPAPRTIFIFPPSLIAFARIAD